MFTKFIAQMMQHKIMNFLVYLTQKCQNTDMIIYCTQARDVNEATTPQGRGRGHNSQGRGHNPRGRGHNPRGRGQDPSRNSFYYYLTNILINN